MPALTARVPPSRGVASPERPKTPYAAVAASPGLGAVAGAGRPAAAGARGRRARSGSAWPLLFLLPLVPVGVALGVVDLRTRLLPTAVVLADARRRRRCWRR